MYSPDEHPAQPGHAVHTGQCAHARSGKAGCDCCSVRVRALCRGPDKEGLAELNRVSFRKRFAADAIVQRAGDRCDWYGVVVSGITRVTKTTADGRRQIVALQFPSEFVGQPFDTSGSLDTEAATTLEVCCFPRAAFDRLLQRDPGMSRAMLEDTMATLDAARDWQLVLGRKTAEEKVASFLLSVMQRIAGADGNAHPPEGGVIEFELPLSRDEIGEFLGLRIETVSRQFSALKSTGVIETTGNRIIRVIKPAELLRRSESEAS